MFYLKSLKRLFRRQTIITSPAISNDAKLLASGDMGGTIFLWDLESRQPIGFPLKIHPGLVCSIAFSPDTKTIASTGLDNVVILSDINPTSWIKQSCQRTGRNLTEFEWKQYLPSKNYPTDPKDATRPKWQLQVVHTPTPTP